MIAHLVLRVTDLDRSRSFYHALGLDFVSEQHGNGPRHYACELGSTVLELYPRGHRPASAIRLGLRVRSTEASEAALRQLGGLEIVGRETDNGKFTVLDPDGNAVDIIETR